MVRTAIRDRTAGVLYCLLLVACACSNRSSGSPADDGAGSSKVCDAAKVRAEELYRAEAAAQTPPASADEIADNVAMVLGDCRTDPALVAACAARATSVAALERDCLIRIDDEGTEGRQFLTR